MTTYKVPTVGQLTSWVASLNEAIEAKRCFLDSRQLPPQLHLAPETGYVIFDVEFLQLMPDKERVQLVLKDFLGYPFTLRVSSLKFGQFVDRFGDGEAFCPSWLLSESVELERGAA